MRWMMREFGQPASTWTTIITMSMGWPCQRLDIVSITKIRKTQGLETDKGKRISSERPTTTDHEMENDPVDMDHWEGSDWDGSRGQRSIGAADNLEE
ncbi:hypothetical protein B0T21DRAFT_101923 [Apiosordaria backusii]|uniref:Uncharacterized protein n=1 Tax=Apiosordaria backusii TaxID=314023 RepID=A0AA40ETX5_9PEZI|nr:hypothetical protein B0T21DRAFT_101923 [Apiosordaria backusii]